MYSCTHVLMCDTEITIGTTACKQRISYSYQAHVQHWDPNSQGFFVSVYSV